MFKGSVSAAQVGAGMHASGSELVLHLSVFRAQKAIEAQKVKVTREGIYIQSQRLTKKEGDAPPGVALLVALFSPGNR